MKRYSSQSCHEIGYKWIIDAPETLTMDDVDALQNALCDYTDTPDNASLQEMLEDHTYCEELDAAKLDEFKKVSIYVESVHRETFTQELRGE